VNVNEKIVKVNPIVLCMMPPPSGLDPNV
jgi:hypothetical protein